MTFRDYSNYEVFEDGRIWSYKTNSFLKPKINKGGYQTVRLADDNGKTKLYLVHRIVYESVTGEPIPKGMQVNHIDENKTNNHINNLNLMTPKENNNWGTRTARATKALSKQVGAFKNGELIFTFPSTVEARRNGFNSVSACCRGEQKTHKGYTWRYL